jgi:hypothetical protein
MLVRRPYRQKRAHEGRATSLDTTSAQDDGARSPLAHYVSEADLSRHTHSARHDDVAHREEVVAVEHALDAMPDDVRDVCRRVMGGSIASVARDLGTSRHRIREMLLAARPYLEQAGFGGN